jgi:hypothetical protein
MIPALTFISREPLPSNAANSGSPIIISFYQNACALRKDRWLKQNPLIGPEVNSYLE